MPRGCKNLRLGIVDAAGCDALIGSPAAEEYSDDFGETFQHHFEEDIGKELGECTQK